MNRIRFPARVVFLDWDGTLLNSYASDVRAYLAMFESLRIAWTEREIERHYSPDWYRVYRAARIPRSKWDLADRLWRRAYGKERPVLLPGAERVLKSLGRHFRLAVITSGSRQRVRRQLREFELADYFSVCICSEDAPRKSLIPPHSCSLSIAFRQTRSIASTSATPQRTFRWRGARGCGQSASSDHFLRPAAFASSAPRCFYNLFGSFHATLFRSTASKYGL